MTRSFPGVGWERWSVVRRLRAADSGVGVPVMVTA